MCPAFACVPTAGRYPETMAMIELDCGWRADTGCMGEFDEDDMPIVELAAKQAADVLWAMSGRQFGACEHTVRPCPSGTGICCIPPGRGYCGGRCERRGPNVIHLPGPVQEIVEVTVGGKLMNPDEYESEGDFLYRLGAVWPAQDMGVPASADGGWKVTYRRGYEPPEYTARLVGLLAQEFYAACTGGKCRLPWRVQTVTRNGLTYNMVDTSTLNEHKTGIAEVDVWLQAVNPNRLAQPARVM